MRNKGEIILTYDEGKVFNDEFESIRKDWDGNTESLKEFTWQRLTDGVRFTDEWVYFKNQLTLLMEKKTQVSLWESPDYAPDIQRSKDDAKFRADNGDSLLRKLVRQPYQFGYIAIREWGKEGFCIEPAWQREKCVLPACKIGFYRDWDRDGICVAVSGGEYD